MNLKTNKMEQTAVEYVIQEIEKLVGINIARDEDIIVKAKKMEMEQTIRFVDEYEYYFLCGGRATMEQYYNETFKNK